MTGHSQLLDVATIVLAPSAPPARIISGAPECGEHTIVDTGSVEIGVWEVTPGVFRSSKVGIGEVMHFISGSGHLEHTDGTTSPIGPGIVIELAPGWEGIWHVEETTRKVYTIYTATAEKGA